MRPYWRAFRRIRRNRHCSQRRRHGRSWCQPRILPRPRLSRLPRRSHCLMNRSLRSSRLPERCRKRPGRRGIPPGRIPLETARMPRGRNTSTSHRPTNGCMPRGSSNFPGSQRTYRDTRFRRESVPNGRFCGLEGGAMVAAPACSWCMRRRSERLPGSAGLAVLASRGVGAGDYSLASESSPLSANGTSSPS
jgi:hypothetical protein